MCAYVHVWVGVGVVWYCGFVRVCVTTLTVIFLVVCCRFQKEQLQEELRDVNDQMRKEEESKGALQVRIFQAFASCTR
jgi:cell division protein FtsL